VKPGGSRVKGSAFERHVAAMICKAFGVPKSECYRTPLSGGHPYGDTGDLVLGPQLLARWPALVECKHRRGWRVEHLLVPSREMEQWLGRLHSRAIALGRIPVLVVRGNRTAIYAVVPDGHVPAECLPVVRLLAAGTVWQACLARQYLESLAAHVL